MARMDYGTAAVTLERAVTLLPEGGYDANLELDLASALFYGGRPGEIEARVTSLAERAALVGDRGAVIRAHLTGAVAHSYVEAGAGIDDLEELVRAVLPELEEIGDPLGLCDAWSAMTLVGHSRLRSAEKLDAAERALSYAREAGDERRVMAVLPYVVNARYYGPTPAQEALTWIEEEQAAGVHHPAFNAHRVQFLAMLGRLEEARATHDQDYARWEQFGPGVPLAISCIIRMELEQTAGDFESAYEWGRRGCDLMEAMGHMSWLSTMSAELGNVLCELGRFDEAAVLAERSRELAAADDIATQIYAREAQAKVLAERGETDAAEELAREAVELAMQTDNINGQAEALLDLGRVLAKAGRRAEADQAVTEAVGLFEQKGNVPMAARAAAIL